MGIFRSNDPTVFDDVDGIVIDESAPPPSIQGAKTNVVLMFGQFERGPSTIESIGSVGELYEAYGNNNAFTGMTALRNKKFGTLKLCRVVASDAVKGTKTFPNATPASAITFTAKFKGAYGNGIKVTIAAGSSTGKKYTIQDTNANAVLPIEIYDNVLIANIVDEATFADSKLVDVTVVLDTSEPANASATALTSGSDGTVADSDYQTAIALAEVEAVANLVFIDSYNATRNGYLKAHAAATQDKMVIVCGAESDSVATAISDVASYRDTAGRIIYAYNHVKTSIDGADVYQAPAFFLASIISQIGPHVDPAFAKNVAFTYGVTGLKKALTRQNYIDLMAAGICAFEYDADLGYKVKSGIVTQIVDSSKVTIVRRRMADYLTYSAAKFLKNYQNAVNSVANRTAVKAAILSFVGEHERAPLSMLPSDNDVKSGKAKIVDTESLNTDDSIGAGKFIVLWKQRLFSSMRFIVVKAEIGETVVVTEN